MTQAISLSKGVGSARRPLEYLLYGVLACLTLLTPFAATSFGAATISVADVFSVLSHKLLTVGESLGVRERIIWELRLPRVLLAFIAGAGLSIAGSVLQTVTRNPLADPYLFGISSGASFGAVVSLTLFSQSILWLSLPVGAFIGASLSVVMVLGLCGRNLSTQVERMLLSGVAISFMFGAMASLMLYFSSPQAAASVLFWTLGSFAKASWQGLWLPAAVVLIAMLIILLNKRQIVAMRAGDETAHTLGINVSHLRLNMLLLCSLITAILVANCGGIGFIGLMVPHTVRLLFPGRYPLLLTALVGGLFMVWVDVLARTLLSYQELPVGIITSVMGSIFFLFILASRNAKRI
ncbi:FecCD family ABC transporter permease [Shewanella pneumatophori]|uniref:Iron ABC transporter permease n=1 Tax=Shewanella pneumatophori TaxID=314092 RepID=A0A9X1ZA49_9GAMM|nr:iron ABC transporter permease [Shewanella pneumatophori]MCL1137711.1 iron ABC transporter permease [Shewanella pneumatophori]